MYSEGQVPFFFLELRKRKTGNALLCVYTHMHVCVCVCVRDTRQRHLSKSWQSHLIHVVDNLGFWGR